VTLYDLSQPVADGSVGYPDDPPVRVKERASVAEDGYRLTELSLSTHAGTHVDAPAHTEGRGARVDQLALSAFRFEAVRLELPEKAPREPIERAELADAAARVAPQAAFEADMVVLETGWDEYAGRDWYRDHPYLTPAAATWCTDNGYHVGVDALSVDPTPSPNARPDEPDGLPAHHELLGSGHLVVENLADVAAPPESFTLHAYPLAVEGLEAAPVRAVAETGEDDDGGFADPTMS
jgi:kynurenine formamidase